ncbi:MAG: MFS transporter [Proteobacteria bacterium]|nr:MFS transporter [Pseudomonadota bacterium]
MDDLGRRATSSGRSLLTNLTEVEPTLSRPRGDFAILFAVLMIVAAGNTALQAVLPAIGRELGLSDTLVTGVFSLSAILWAVTAPMWARASDRRGRKPLIQMGLSGFVVSMVGFGLVVEGGLRGWLGPAAVFTGLMLARGLFGFLGSASAPAAQAYVAERTAPEARTNALATLASAFGLGTVLGPAIAPFMALPPIGLIGPVFGSAILAAVVLVVVTRGLPNPRPTAERQAATPSRRGLWRDARVRPFLVYAFGLVSIQAVNIASLGFLVIDTVDLPPARAQTFVGAALMAGAVSGLLAQWGLIRILHMSPRSLMRWGAGLAALGNLALSVAPDFGTVVFSYGLMSIGFGFARPGFTAGGSLAVEEGEQGSVAGAMTAVIGAAFVVSPVAGVALYEVWRPAPFLMNAIFCLALLGYALKNRALQAARSPAEPPSGLDHH